MSNVSDRDRWFVVRLELPGFNGENNQKERVHVPAGHCADALCEYVWWLLFNSTSGCGAGWDEVEEGE
jgi:hypothetical protein